MFGNNRCVLRSCVNVWKCGVEVLVNCDERKEGHRVLQSEVKGGELRHSRVRSVEAKGVRGSGRMNRNPA